jgi:hypothetical protein
MRNLSKGRGMNTLASEVIASGVSFDSDNMWVELADGRKLGVPLAYFPRLLHANSRQRKNYIISGGGTGLHWENIDEDICVKSLIMGVGDKTRSRLTRKPITRKVARSGRW